MTRRASRLFLLAAFLWLGCLSALAIRPASLETRVGGCGHPAPEGLGPAASQVLATATGCGGRGGPTASGQGEGHKADPSLYAFCAAGEPVNYFDPDGRLSAQTENQQNSDSQPSSGSYAENLASQMGINYIPQLAGESASDYASRLGLSGGMANSPWAIASASGSYALFSGIMNSGGVPDPDYQETPWGGQWLVNAALNSDAISEAYNEFTHPDFSSGIGIATFGVAGVSMVANSLNVVGNALTLGELGAAEEGSVQIFRAVGRNETSTILSGATYGSAPSMGGKYFALTQQGAEDFASASINAGRQMTITSTTIPQSVFNQGFLFNDVGGAGASIHFQQEFLPTLYNSMTPIQFH